MVTMPSALTCQVAPVIEVICTPGYLKENHQSPVGGSARPVMEISPKKPADSTWVVLYAIRGSGCMCARLAGAGRDDRSAEP